MQKQLTECKLETVEILETKEALQSAVQHLKIALDESKQEKAKIVDSKKRLAIDLETTRMQLTKKCEQIDALEEKIECPSQQSGAGRMLSLSIPSLHYTSQYACAIPKSKEEGIFNYAVGELFPFRCSVERCNCSRTKQYGPFRIKVRKNSGKLLLSHSSHRLARPMHLNTSLGIS